MGRVGAALKVLTEEEREVYDWVTKMKVFILLAHMCLQTNLPHTVKTLI